MAVETHIYDDFFFDNTRKLEEDSAKAFSKIILTHFDFKSIVDIGCGIGIYLKEFKAEGKEILGYDGAPAAISKSLVGDNIILHDLSLPLVLNKKFDLCLSIEVAEHLPEESADTFVSTITNAADTVIFTAAIPGQADRELGHINEQPHEYWIEKFEAEKFVFDKELSLQLRQEMKERGVIWWIVNNLMIFRKKQ